MLQFQNGNTTSYLYSNDGVKRKVTHLTAIANVVIPMGSIQPLSSGQIAYTSTTDYCGNVIYEDGILSKILTDEGYITLGGSTPTYHYYLKDHLGNNRVVMAQSGTVEQINHYYPFGGLFGEGTATSNQAYKYNGKELDRMHGLDWYDYGVRFYDSALGRWNVVDPLAEERPWLSPYNYCQNNPIIRIDPDGALDDWIYNKDTEEYAWDGNITKPSETPSGYEYVGPSLKDVDNHFEDNNSIASFFTNPKFVKDRTPWPGEFLLADKLTSLELWLGSPSESIGEGIGKIGANIGYSIVNSPYSLFTGQTIGGSPLNSTEKIEAFIDFVPGLISVGLTKTGAVVKTTEKGLQGYNQFLKGAKKSGMEFKGLNWHQNAGKAFQSNKVNQQGLKDLDKARNVLNIGNATKIEIKK